MLSTVQDGKIWSDVGEHGCKIQRALWVYIVKSKGNGLKSIADDKLVPSSLDLLLGETFWKLFLHNSVYSRLFSSRKYTQEGLPLNMGLYSQKSLDLDTFYLVTSAYTCPCAFWYHKRQYLVFLDMQAKMFVSVPTESYVLSFVCLKKKGLR